MKHLNLKNCWSKSKGAVNGWCSIPSTTTAEMMSLNKFDSLTIDLQHGLIDYQLALNMLQSLNSNEITLFVLFQVFINPVKPLSPSTSFTVHLLKFTYI